ncbi:OmpA family protein [Sphingomonas sp.]|uniref:OmpA family protein n=1 Tax=Sphingomonas sp. TaxID=28214 RepID=UPI000DB3D703|nr:OmpA family protein [Sphingomonas sp.]PZU07762.1 MAG: OmpA family protein [Sphingomonas sp.]
MVRLVLFLLFALAFMSVALAVKSCSNDMPDPAPGPVGNPAGVVALSDGSTMIAQPGSVGRDLVDWLARGDPGRKKFELGGQEFVGRTAVPTAESLGRTSRLIAMLRANPDVDVTIVGHTDPSDDAAADRSLGLARANALSRLLRDGHIAAGRISVESRGSSDPIAPNGTVEGRARNQRVTLYLSRDR